LASSKEIGFAYSGTTCMKPRRTAKGYELTPWEGHFSGYRRHQGVLVPTRGEVGWYADGRLKIVWRGEIASLEYEFGPLG